MSFPLPSGVMAQIRTQANQFFTELIEVYEVALSYDTYGRERETAGLLFTTSAYIGKVIGKDKELIDEFRKMFTGTRTESFITCLWPYGNPASTLNIIKAQTDEFRIVWTNSDTSDDVRAYEKALCAKLDIEPEKRERF